MTETERPAKRAKFIVDLADDSDSGIDNGDFPNGNGNGFAINEDYAKRFEHNKKREEKQRLEEKYGDSANAKRKHARPNLENEDEDDSSSDESEDSNAELVTEDVDEEWNAALQAIRNKDPRVYDANVKFYKDFDPELSANGARKEKPMFLQDYHRQNLFARSATVEDDEEDELKIQTYQEEQDQLKRELVGSMHAAVQESHDGSDDDFMVAKSRSKIGATPVTNIKRGKTITEGDIKAAEKDPETFLSNFMAARAWLPTDSSRPQAFDSDDSEDDKRADEFEEAYNMRFEDPKTANEKLQSFARDVGKYGVRRDERSGRARARGREREQKEFARREREEEKARLRKLKIEEAEKKVKRIKEAAGLHGKTMDLDQWRDVIEGDFDDDKWEEEMQRRFGDDYYAEEDDLPSENGAVSASKGRKLKKPKWDDEIDIKDLVPDFDEGKKPEFTLTDDEEDGGTSLPESDSNNASTKKRKSKKDREKEKSEAKRAARKERREIEKIVDAALPFHDPALTAAATSKVPVTGFRYRETSPTSFGMNARDILFADDAQLNQFAGLKKLHAFRDSERKMKDRQKLGKKQRLQKWRKETFGKSSVPQGGFEKILGGDSFDAKTVMESSSGVDVKEGARKRKRKNKVKGVE